ncbi:hypothetical protein ACPUER_12110 [Burkholderia sp. DN3021]|uniref:hypothetical protein n=1 Tax=Burkholderia sp. DN3021 TaxID=3410137 RepID=UPI003C7D1454
MNTKDALAAYSFGPSGYKKDTTLTVTIPLDEYDAMKRKIAQLERQAASDSWRTNPDRMGA